MRTQRLNSTGRGFTLIEILVVVAILAVVSAVSVLALRDTEQDELEREALRLMALLESARAQSRTTGVPITWQANAKGFAFIGMPVQHSKNTLPTTWRTPVQIGASGSLNAIQHNGQAILVLGPEPILPAQKVTLQLPQRPEISYTIASDGVRPFDLQGTSHAP